MIRPLLCSSLVLLAIPSAHALEPIALSEGEFRMYQQYRLALADARVQAMKPAMRLNAIAKDAGFNVKELGRAVNRAEAAGNLKASCEANLKQTFQTGELAGRVGRLEVDTSSAQAITYVQWFNEDTRTLASEASFAAAQAIQACPISSTVTVWAQDKAAPKVRVFQALISSTSAKRIDVAKVKDFAETRYMKLFEKVKNAANGDELSAEAETP